MTEEGPPMVGTAAVREAYATVLSFGGRITLATRHAVECDELALLSNEYTFTATGYEASWTTSEVARRQPDGSWRSVIDNPYAAPVTP